MFWGGLNGKVMTTVLFTAIGAASVTTAQAADLDYGDNGYGPRSAPYADGYYDRYSRDDDRRWSYNQRRPYSSYKDNYSYDNDYSYRRDYRNTDRRAYDDAPYVREGREDYAECGGITRMPRVNYSGYCEDPQAIYGRLKYEGWHDFRGLRVRPRAFRVFARSEDGTSYKLRVDRCTGEILQAERKLAPFYQSRFSW